MWFEKIADYFFLLILFYFCAFCRSPVFFSFTFVPFIVFSFGIYNGRRITHRRNREYCSVIYKYILGVGKIFSVYIHKKQFWIPTNIFSAVDLNNNNNSKNCVPCQVKKCVAFNLKIFKGKRFSRFCLRTQNRMKSAHKCTHKYLYKWNL